MVSVLPGVIRIFPALPVISFLVPVQDETSNKATPVMARPILDFNHALPNPPTVSILSFLYWTILKPPPSMTGVTPSAPTFKFDVGISKSPVLSPFKSPKDG